MLYPETKHGAQVENLKQFQNTEDAESASSVEQIKSKKIFEAKQTKHSPKPKTFTEDTAEKTGERFMRNCILRLSKRQAQS